MGEKEELKTSAEWVEDCPFIVSDPDGWDRTNYQYSYFEEKITKEEFNLRVLHSTCMGKVKEKMIRPFSNGTEAMNWYGNNCECCVKAYWPKDGKDYPDNMQPLINLGMECGIKYEIDMSHITSEMPESFYIRIGLPGRCKEFSDNPADSWKARYKRGDAPVDKNQVDLFKDDEKKDSSVGEPG